MTAQFTQINYSWYGLIRKCDLSMEDINLLGLIDGLSKAKHGCIANDTYFEKILNVPNIRFNIQRLENANLIKVSNGKVRKIVLNEEILSK